MKPPIVGGRDEPKISASDIGRKLFLSVAYIGASGAMVCFNKYLMSPGRFPYAMALPAIHMAFNLVVCAILYGLNPAWFPGMTRATGCRMQILGWFVPMGTFFAVSLCATNKAYLYLSMACVQFMKEANVGIIFLMSCVAGLQRLTGTKVAIIMWIICGASASVTGEVRFVWAGIIIQVFGQLCDCARVVMAEIVLKGGGLNLDPLSYMLFSAPISLLVLSVGNFVGWDSAIPLALHEWWPQILLNTLMAFVLNALLPLTLKELSAVGMTLCGVCKDVAVVVFSSVVFGAPLTHQQMFAFTCTVAGVWMWSFIQSNSENKTLLNLEYIMFQSMSTCCVERKLPDPRLPSEATPLVA